MPDDDILRALQSAYQDGSWGRYHGGHVARLEERLAGYHHTSHALTCGSGTFAIELALRALKVGPGDEVLLAAYDYGGNFLSVHAVAATPVLIDVASGNWNLDPAHLEAAITPATRAIIASHLHGGVVPMQEVMAVAQRHGLAVIEDAAQMPGAIIKGRKAGTWGDVGVLSFGGSKLLTAGRGGALLTSSPGIYQRARVALHRGNVVCPLSELQAAALLPQLDRLDQRNAARQRAVGLLRDGLQDIPGLHPFVNAVNSSPGYYKVGFQLDAAHFGVARDGFLAAIRAEGIAFDEGFRALHIGRSPGRFRTAGPLPEAERAHHGVVILHHPVLLGSEADLRQVVQAVRKVYANAAYLGS
jgi:dTDP-4-amino-4,6-dideoxygalactose transaminase